MRILITDGGERAALATARSLVAAGYRVYVAARRRSSLAGVSRGVRSWRVRSDALDRPAHYAAEVAAVARAQGVDVLLPVTDPSVEALLEHRNALPEHVLLPFPDLDTYRRASDKAHTLELAGAAGLAVPDTLLFATPADCGNLPAASFFPAVLKPHRSVIPAEVMGDVRKRKVGVTYVDDPASCRAGLAALPAGAFPVLLQRRVRGPGEGLFLLRWNGRVLAAFAHRRLREKPPAGGVSVYRESIAAPPELVAAGTRLLEVLDWRGVAIRRLAACALLLMAVAATHEWFGTPAGGLAKAPVAYPVVVGVVLGFFALALARFGPVPNGDRLVRCIRSRRKASLGRSEKSCRCGKRRARSQRSENSSRRPESGSWSSAKQASTGQASTHASQSMHSSGSM